MDIRYQVFVSSTYADLKDERNAVIEVIMEMDCIPSAMEMFPAIDSEQFEFIKKVINDCDYYLLIIGGKYGSLTSDGISYTEKEYDYAVENNIKVIALIHGAPENIPVGKSETSAEIIEKFEKFKEKVKANRLVKFWKNAEDLPGLVSRNLAKTIKTFPAIGWTRADKVGNSVLQSQINELTQKNLQLNELIEKIKDTPIIDNIAEMSSIFKMVGKYKGVGYVTNHSIHISWKDLFSIIAPYLEEHPADQTVKYQLTLGIKKMHRLEGSLEIDDQDFKTIAIQLKAYGLIKTSYAKTVSGGMALFWSLTPKGEALMMEFRVIRKDNSDSE